MPDILHEVAAMVQENDRLRKDVNDLCDANKMMRRELHTQISEGLSMYSEAIQPLKECAARHSWLFNPGDTYVARAATIIDAAADLYRTLQHPMESVKDALAAFEKRVGIKA